MEDDMYMEFWERGFFCGWRTNMRDSWRLTYYMSLGGCEGRSTLDEREYPGNEVRVGFDPDHLYQDNPITLSNTQIAEHSHNYNHDTSYHKLGCEYE